MAHRRCAASDRREEISSNAGFCAPPPLTMLRFMTPCSSRHGGLRSIRKNGRFVLQEVSTPRKLMFQSVRRDGRLLLLLFHKDDDRSDQSELSSGKDSNLVDDSLNRLEYADVRAPRNTNGLSEHGVGLLGENADVVGGESGEISGIRTKGISRGTEVATFCGAASQRNKNKDWTFQSVVTWTH